MQGAVNTCGTGVIAAFTASTRIEAFANSFGDSGASSTSIIAAQNFGAEDKERVERTFRESLRYLFILGIICSVLMYLTTRQTSAFVLSQSSGEAFEASVGYIRTISLFYILCFTGNTFAGYFEGIGRVTIPFFGTLTHITIRVIISWIFIGKYGLNTVAIATGIGWIYVNILWGIIKYRSSRASKSTESAI